MGMLVARKQKCNTLVVMPVCMQMCPEKDYSTVAKCWHLMIINKNSVDQPTKRIPERVVLIVCDLYKSVRQLYSQVSVVHLINNITVKLTLPIL